MVVTLDELKLYLRVDTEDEDVLLMHILIAAEKLCLDVMRAEFLPKDTIPNLNVAVMYAAAYLYEHREEAEHKSLQLTLRALLHGSRKDAF